MEQGYRATSSAEQGSRAMTSAEQGGRVMFEEGQGGWEMVLIGSVAPSSKNFFEGLCVKQLLSGSDTTYLPLLLPHQEIPL